MLLHLHRFRADVLSGRCQISVRADGGGSGIHAMVASFILSRTLVPTMAKFLLKPHNPNAHDTPTRNPFTRFQRKFEHGFEALRLSYRGLLDRALSRRALFLLFSFGFIGLSFYLVPYTGAQFLPAVGTGADPDACAARGAGEHASRRVHASSPKSRTSFARPFRRMRLMRLSTTSACRSAASTSPITTPA